MRYLARQKFELASARLKETADPIARIAYDGEVWVNYAPQHSVCEIAARACQTKISGRNWARCALWGMRRGTGAWPESHRRALACRVFGRVDASSASSFVFRGRNGNQQALKRRQSPLICHGMSVKHEASRRGVDAGTGHQRADARRNRRLILDAAEAAFAIDGVSASLDDIARSAGVGPGTLYRHFPTREHLLCEVLHERQAVLLSRRDEAWAMPCAENALRAWMVALKDYLSAFNGLPRPFIDAFEAQASPLAVTCRALVAITGEFLSRAQAEGAARQSVSAPALFLSALGSAFVHDKAGDYGTTPKLIEEILAFGYLTGGSAADTPDPPNSIR
jgi:AcrR family transcriptional regulator